MANGVLEVLLEHAEGIKERKLLSCISCFNNVWDARKPYISLKFGNQELISEVAQGKGRKFVWNEKFTFLVDYQGEENVHAYDRLILNVMDKHKFSEDDFVGETMTHVKEVVLQGMEKGTLELKSQKYRVVRPDKTYSGAISISITFKRKDGMEKKVMEEDLGAPKDSNTKIDAQPTVV